MNLSIKNDQWVYVLVHGPEGNEQLLGQQDPENKASFVPAFLKKEDALMNINLLAREKGTRYEAQAILYEDLILRVRDQGVLIFVLNESGEVLKKIAPGSTPPSR